MKITKYLAAFSAAALFLGAPAPAQAPGLHVADAINFLRVENGKPGHLVGAFLGFHEVRFQIPGNAWVLVDPAIVAVLGQFDPAGVHETPVEWAGAPVEPIEALLQAVSLNPEGDKFQVSPLMNVRFDGVAQVRFELR